MISERFRSTSRSLSPVVVLFSLTLAISGFGTEYKYSSSATCFPEPTPGTQKVDYKGVAIGMKAEEVRGKLGSPKDKSDSMDLYVFSDDESAQFYYDPSKTVMAMMVTYSGDLKKAPTPRDIFGEDVEARADGSVSKMVRYPKQGYWISYNKTAGDDAIVNVAYQKINQ